MPLRHGLLALLLSGALLVPIPSSAEGGSEDPRSADWIAVVPEGVREDLQDDGLALAPNASGESVAGFALFDAPIGLTYNLLSQTDRQAEYRKELKGVRRIASRGQFLTDEHRIRVMFLSLRYAIDYRLDPKAYTIRWQLSEEAESQIEHISGSWILSAAGAHRTLGRFETSVRVGKGLPVSLQQLFTRRKVPKMLEENLSWVNQQAGALSERRSATMSGAGEPTP